MLWQKTWIQFFAPTWKLTTTCNSTSRTLVPSSFHGHQGGTQCTYTHPIQTCSQILMYIKKDPEDLNHVILQAEAIFTLAASNPLNELCSKSHQGLQKSSANLQNPFATGHKNFTHLQLKQAESSVRCWLDTAPAARPSMPTPILPASNYRQLGRALVLW